jgi:hypothetical protein
MWSPRLPQSPGQVDRDKQEGARASATKDWLRPGCMHTRGQAGGREAGGRKHPGSELQGEPLSDEVGGRVVGGGRRPTDGESPRYAAAAVRRPTA